MLRPFPVADILQKRDNGIRTSSIGCQTTASPFIRAMAEKAKELHWPLLAINTGHCPMVTGPVELAQAMMMQTAAGQDFYSFFA